jgi:hypothetical protein
LLLFFFFFWIRITVRRAVLYCICIVVTRTIPTTFLFENLPFETKELEVWLSELFNKEADEQCLIFVNYLWSVLADMRKQFFAPLLQEK